jgi:hypothetical protein
MQMIENTIFNYLLLDTYYKVPITIDNNLTATVKTFIGY